MIWRGGQSYLSLFVFFFSRYGPHRDLHSFPTRRSSDLRDRSAPLPRTSPRPGSAPVSGPRHRRSEEHTSELQSQFHLVCPLLLEKQNTTFSSSPPEYASNMHAHFNPANNK